MALTALIGPATKLIGKFVRDKDKAAQLSHDIATMAEKHAQELALAQIKLNTEEAKGNWFQSSWRPLVGWICALSLGINFMVAPICSGFGITIPQADMSVMMPLLLGMLGIGGLRSLDKIKKVDTKKI
jgi:hypothetical protein|tara:strand:- start:606 stop:989 length:384 start_codon:yes stop_codon:yes gene_type:complete